MASRDLDDLHPDLKPLCDKWLWLADRADIHPLITCTYRSPEEQAELYAQGRTKPGKIVTWVTRSNHNFTLGEVPASLAFDFVPVTLEGKPVWSSRDPMWKRLGNLAQDCGLVWGGNWKQKDMPHIELANAKEYWA